MSDTRRIEDYALLGDLQTAALVHRSGSIDWCCFPRFDSGACFAALLGGPEHGRWLLAPAGEVTHTERRYREDTLILETLFETAEGAVCVIDFMPSRGCSAWTAPARPSPDRTAFAYVRRSSRAARISPPSRSSPSSQEIACPS